jgi:hypothetical protein
MPSPPDSRPKLAAPPKAQQVHAKKKSGGLLGSLPGLMGGRKKKGKREASPPVRTATTSATPTTERKYKEPYGWLTQEHVGGQVGYRPKVFVDVFDHHFDDEDRESIALLLAAWELATRVRVTSDRAYTGKPFTGGVIDVESAKGPTRIGQRLLTEKNQQDLEIFAHAYQLLVADSAEFWEPLKAHVLRIPDERTGRLPTIADLGAAVTDYKLGTDNATASGLGFMKACIKRWRECVQGAHRIVGYKRRQRQEQMAKAVTQHAMREQAKRRA